MRFFVNSGRKVVAIVVSLLVVAAGIAAWALLAGRGPSRPNILLVSIDTLRADHLRCYGYAANTSPNLDAFAKQRAILFETVVAAAPSTAPSHASILTSLVSARHGVSVARQTALPEDRVTLAEILKGAGYRTMSVNDGGQMESHWGFAQGFDEYVTLPDAAESQRFSKTVGAALHWLDESREAEAPWFVFLHTYETHHPYTPDRRFLDAIGDRYSGSLPDATSIGLIQEINRGARRIDDKDRRHIVATYDAEIRSMDDAFGQLLSALRERDLLDSTLIVFTSDHGEEFGEHGKIGWHSHTLWDELLLVPLLVALPDGRGAGMRIPAQVRGIDVMPTILDHLGITPPPEAQGRSLMPLVEGEPDPPRPALSQLDARQEPPPSSLRIGGRKLYLPGIGRPPQLFDLVADPGEKKDLGKGDGTLVAAMTAQVDEFVGAAPRARAGRSVKLDAAALEKLRALGYLASGSSTPGGANRHE